MAFPNPPKTWGFQESVESSEMNAELRDALLLVPHSIPKTADETVTSSVTLQDDNHLTFAIAANEIWSVRFVMWFSNAADAGHFKIAFNGPAGVTYHIAADGMDTASVRTLTQHRVVANTSSYFATSTGVVATAEGVVVNGGTAGNFTLQWAQNTSNATGTILKRGSYLWRQKQA